MPTALKVSLFLIITRSPNLLFVHFITHVLLVIVCVTANGIGVANGPRRQWQILNTLNHSAMLSKHKETRTFVPAYFVFAHRP